MARITVLVADSQHLFAESLAMTLRREEGLTVVPEHPTSGLGCLKTAIRTRPHIVVFDHWLQGMHGSLLVSVLRRQVPGCRVIVLTWLCDQKDVADVVRCGASAVVGKDEAPQQVAAAIRAVYSDDAPATPPFPSLFTPPMDTLTPREIEVLEVIDLGIGDAARALSLSPKTLRHHVHTICIKLGVQSQAEALALARSSGIVHPTPLSNDALKDVIEDGGLELGEPAAERRIAVLLGPGVEPPSISFPIPHRRVTEDKPESISVLIADAQRMFAEALAQALRSTTVDIRVVDEHPLSGLDVADAAERLYPDVALLDYWMPGLDGPRAAAELLARVPECAVIMISWVYSPIHVRTSLEMGAVGFLPKGIALEELRDAIRQAAAGTPLVFGPQLARLVDRLETGAHASTLMARRVWSLTDRQKEVLKLLGEGRSYAQIASTLNIEQRSVKSYVHTMLKRTGATSAAQLVAVSRFSRVFSD